MSVLERCPSYRESNKGSKERQGPTLSVRFTEVVHVIEVSAKRESAVIIILIMPIASGKVYCTLLGFCAPHVKGCNIKLLSTIRLGSNEILNGAHTFHGKIKIS